MEVKFQSPNILRAPKIKRKTPVVDYKADVLELHPHKNGTYNKHLNDLKNTCNSVKIPNLVLNAPNSIKKKAHLVKTNNIKSKKADYFTIKISPLKRKLVKFEENCIDSIKELSVLNLQCMNTLETKKETDNFKLNLLGGDDDFELDNSQINDIESTNEYNCNPMTYDNNILNSINAKLKNFNISMNESIENNEDIINDEDILNDYNDFVLEDKNHKISIDNNEDNNNLDIKSSLSILKNSSHRYLKIKNDKLHDKTIHSNNNYSLSTCELNSEYNNYKPKNKLKDANQNTNDLVSFTIMNGYLNDNTNIYSPIKQRGVNLNENNNNIININESSNHEENGLSILDSLSTIDNFKVVDKPFFR